MTTQAFAESTTEDQLTFLDSSLTQLRLLRKAVLSQAGVRSIVNSITDQNHPLYTHKAAIEDEAEDVTVAAAESFVDVVSALTS